jgi:hypothetical protein
MQTFARVIRVVLVVSALLGSNSLGISGNVFQDAWGIASDPIGLQRASSELSASGERTLIQLRALGAQTNYDVQQRLEQVRAIVQDAISGTRETIEIATTRMHALEAAINADAIKLIYRAQCASEVVLMNQFQRAFAQLIANLKKADPSIRILGITVVDLTAGDIKIDNPDDAYISTKSAVFDTLKREVSDKSKAYRILSAYQNLEVAAKFTRCHYIDQALEKRWVEEVNELERLSLPWVLVVTPTM